MTTIHRMVAATEFSPASDAAVRRAAHLAATHGAALCLVHAFAVGVWQGLKTLFDAQRLTMDPPPDVRTQQRLADCAASLAASTGLEVGVDFGLGPPAKVIEAHVKDHGSSPVVIGSRAGPALSGLGSTALKVVRKPACPVLMVRVAEDKPDETVLSAVDLRAGSVRAASLAVAMVADDVPARAILVGAANLAADCVVMGHHGLGTATESHLGSMAQHVTCAALADVLVVP